MEISALADEVVHFLGRIDSCVVAFSGGVDSAVVAKAAQLALADRAVAVTAVSESLASGEYEIAEKVALAIGIKHDRVFTDELSNDAYLANDGNRCWHCKSNLYDRLRSYCSTHGYEVVANGTITDDLGDYRPGLLAAQEAGVISPLVELNVDKRLVRELAAYWDLEVWDKPASPCLSSRVAYGVAISAELLNRIDAAEAYLKKLGLREFRVRCHQDNLARIEVTIDCLPLLLDEERRLKLVAKFKSLGFHYLTLDLEGFRSGSFNQLVQLRV